MKKLTTKSMVASLAVSMCLLATTAMAAEGVIAPARVTGEKIDSGLGDLPHHSRWGVHTAGEKIDSGLGDLPHYSQWADPTGKNPLRAVAPVQRDEEQPQRVTVRVSQAN